ncbi:hypothetical protein P43SY_007776 [Pythium insidiosum]|uniref:Tubby C-terminal domain-containing protein n=1 Tax=Pythium insidiosum TaxID=114742 RepID=A0AAD5LW47_PYTIN|nr:hypothetical protein P43SY_007776 [Pythium insidiosum]
MDSGDVDLVSPRLDEAKKTTRPPSAALKAPPSADPKPVKREPPASKPTPAHATRAVAAVDILGDGSPNLDDAIASAPASATAMEKAPVTVKLSHSTAPPQSTLMRAGTLSAGMHSSSTNPTPKPMAAPKKSTLEVLNEATGSVSRGTARSGPSASIIDESDVKRSAVLNDVDRPTTSAPTVSRAVPISGSFRPNVPDEEVVLVKKQEVKHVAESHSEAKGAKHVIDLEDSIDDVEEIPFLEDANPAEPKKDTRRQTLIAHDDDPVIMIESKAYTAPARSKAAEAKSASDSSNNDEKNGDDDDDALLAKAGAKGVEKEDVYDELRKLKRAGTMEADARDPEGVSSSSSSPSPTSHEARRTRDAGDYGDDDPRDSSDHGQNSSSSSSRERRERRRERRRGKHDDEPKRIQPQFFNPKSVPFVPDHLLDFVRRPLECGRGHIVKCFIERNEQSKLSPVYTLLLEVTNVSGRPIMYARKKPTSRITSHYVISLNKEDLFLPRMMRSHQYIGKLRSSTSMMEYCLYDQGDNPEDLDSDCEIDDEIRKNIRAELAVIRYHNSKKPYPRKIEVAIPSIVENGSAYLDWRPMSRDQMMEEHMRAITTAGGQNVLDTHNFIFMHKRETKYDPLSSCIVDFRSRATCTSVKNFQLVHSEPTNDAFKDKYRKLHADFVYEDQGTVSLPQEFVLLQLGKVGKHCFNMDFQYPLSMLQAFAIALSRFDTKQR